MNFLITLLILIFILGLIIVVHEFGHFIAAKKSGVYVDEFSLGMGPAIWKSKRIEGTVYAIRAFPIGGYVAMANEEAEGLKLKKDQILENKSFIQRLLVLLMGIIFNCILAIVLLFINGLAYGSPDDTPIIGQVLEDSVAYEAGMLSGDVIKEVNGKKMTSWDDVLLEILVKKSVDSYEFTLDRNGEEKVINVVPDKVIDENGDEVNSFGIGRGTVYKHGFVNAIKYSINSFLGMSRSLFTTLVNLFNGSVSVKKLSGPVGIFSLIDEVKSSGLETIIYLIAYLSVNVGIINLLPIPVFDGGRVLLLIIEKIANKKFPKLEAILNYIGFGLLVLLMLFVTFNDILKLF